MVNLHELIAKTDFINMNMAQLFTGETASDYRVMTTLEQWENEKYVDPPIIEISTYSDGKLSVSDGRHRIKVASHLGAQRIPIAINTFLEPKIREIIKIEEINTETNDNGGINRQ
jgi:hypothetical protein